MDNYQLSKAAQDDLEDILYYGMELFGIEQSLVYKNGIKAQIEQVAANPLHYQQLDKPLERYRRSTYKSHTIYYLIEEQSVFIVRILNKQDRETNLSH